MLANSNLDFIQSSLHSSLLLLTVRYTHAFSISFFYFFLCSFRTCTFCQENVFPSYIFVLGCCPMAAAVYRPLLPLSLPPGVDHSIPSPAQASTASAKPAVEKAFSLFPARAKTSPICPSHVLSFREKFC